VAESAPDIAAKMNYHTSIPQSGEQAEVLKDKLTPKAIVAALNEHIIGQNDAKKAGQPWDAAKGFDNSAPVGALTPAGESRLMKSARIWLSVNGEKKQDANLEEMIWSVPEIIATLSRTWELRAGDLIFTGTPSGVSALQRGDVVTCGIEGLSDLMFSIAN